MRALEDQAERLGSAASSSSMQPLNNREELMQAEAHEPKVMVLPDPGNPSAAEQDEHNATHLPFQSWFEHCVPGKMLKLPHKRRSSDRDVSQTQTDYCFMNRNTDSELMTVLNFLDCESGCSFACAVNKGPRSLLSWFRLQRHGVCAAGRESRSERTMGVLSLR